MPFYRCTKCDNNCTADISRWYKPVSKNGVTSDMLKCPMTGKHDAGFREVDPASEDPCFACTDHCPAHNCARKQDFEERIETGCWYDEDEYEEEDDDYDCIYEPVE